MVSRIRRRSRRTRDRAAKQQALIVAALKLFAKKGYEATTTREIASCAGCAEGLIHRYFKSKAGLLPALMENRVSQEVADLAEHVRPAHSFEKEYLQLVTWAVEHMWGDRAFLRVSVPQALLDRDFGQVLRQDWSNAEGAGNRRAAQEILGMPRAFRYGVRCSGAVRERIRIHVRFYAARRVAAGPEDSQRKQP